MDNRPELNRPEDTQLVPSTAFAPVATGSYGYGSSSGVDFEENAGNFSTELAEYWWAIRKRLSLVISIILGCVALGTIITLMMTPLYTSTVSLQIDKNVAKVVEGGNVTPVETGDNEFLKTQYEILQSRSLAERVVNKLQLGNDPNFVTNTGFFGSIARFFGFNSLALGRTEKDMKAADKILERRAVRPVFGSRLVNVSYTDPNPATAQKVADALVAAFIAVTLDKRFEANSYAKIFLDDQLKQMQIKLQDAERAQLEFGEKEQIIATTAKTSIAESNLAEANIALGKIISERIRDEQLFNQAGKGNITDIRQVQESKVIEELRKTRNQFLTEYKEKLQLFKPNYPDMVQLDNKIKEIDQRILFEATKIKSALRNSFESSIAQEKEMQAQIEKLKNEVLDLQKRSIKYNILKREADVNRSIYESLLQRYKEVDIAGGVGANNIFVVDKAELPKIPSSPRVILNVFLSSLLGIVLGVMSALGIEWFDDSIRSVNDLEKISKMPTLGVIPKTGISTTVSAELSLMHSPVSEAYRTLATSLYFASDRGLPKSLFITSSGPGEGKSTTAVAIARHFAATGLKVLLIDGDLRRPSLHLKLGLENSVGLSNYLTNASSPPKVFQRTDDPNLTFLSSGPLPPNAANILSSPRLVALISAGDEVFDLIIIDGPPVMGLADAILLSSVCSATIYVAASGIVRKQALSVSLRRLKQTRSRLIGCVLTLHDSSTASYGDSHYYGYGYGDQHRNQEALANPHDATETTQKS